MTQNNEKINLSSEEEPIINNRQEKIITRKGIIITCILLFFVSIFLDLYFIFISKAVFFMKVILCLIHPMLFVIFCFIPSGLFIEFNYTEKKFKYYKTCIIPYIWDKCTKNEIELENIEKFNIHTSVILWLRPYSLSYTNKNGEEITIASGRDKNCRCQFSKEVLNIPTKLNCWLKNEDFQENEPFSKNDPEENMEKE